MSRNSNSGMHFVHYPSYRKFDYLDKIDEREDIGFLELSRERVAREQEKAREAEQNRRQQDLARSKALQEKMTSKLYAVKARDKYLRRKHGEKGDRYGFRFISSKTEASLFTEKALHSPEFEKYIEFYRRKGNSIAIEEVNLIPAGRRWKIDNGMIISITYFRKIIYDRDHGVTGWK